MDKVMTYYSKKVRPKITQVDWDDQFTYKEQRRFWTYRDKAHYYFDKIWKHHGLTREEAYYWLADKMLIHRSKCHFSMFSIPQCQQAIRFVLQQLNDLRRLDMDFGNEPKTPFYIIPENDNQL